ncbi:hypothetical protein [Mucilaginibacter sp. L3T2-6]|uniref:hypothetical protein n=1 Tax=Mucilaginibacter sp. L3T2-6 TaxID=3062491 RepID=UPI0026758F8A|nr:hypothetical protein [Mucilaginibacter sp. L3T2-6]MDO3641985.1 hypothetical protein [Mucilaginibacter sp. L3T2-6]MDV6214337.1 hypothetical protein [Mucilaginibacter sp. L3T2-6]
MKLLDFIHNTKAQAALAILIVVGGALMVIFGHLKEATETKILDIIYLVPAYYFISSKSSNDKDKTIANLSQPTQSTN